MSDRSDDLCPLDREAHRWVALLVSGEASTVDADDLRRWRRLSPDHEQAFVRARRRWRDYGRAGETLLASGQVPDWTPTQQRISRRALLGSAAVGAAAVAGYAVVRPPLGLWPSLTELAADYRTGTGEQRSVTLASQVAIRLNTRTSIAVPHDRGGDDISLIAGEASFTIPPAGQPVTVEAAGGRSTAQRGRFDIRKSGAQVCVTCVDGEVAIRHATRSAVARAGQQVRYDADGLQLATAADLDVSTAWQDGTLVFRMTPLAEVVDEINRYRPGRVVLMNNAIGADPVNGRFRIQRIDEVLAWIEQAFGIRRRSLPGGVVLLG